MGGLRWVWVGGVGVGFWGRYGSVIDALRETAAMCNQGSTDWSMIRVGFGGNGILIHWNDAIGLGNCEHVSGGVGCAEAVRHM